MTQTEILEYLRALNPRTSETELAIFAVSFAEYQAAAVNIEKHGPIVFHPRTGAPIANPYIPIRDNAAKTMRSIRVKVGELWQLAEQRRRELLEAAPPE